MTPPLTTVIAMHGHAMHGHAMRLASLEAHMDAGGTFSHANAVELLSIAQQLRNIVNTLMAEAPKLDALAEADLLLTRSVAPVDGFVELIRRLAQALRAREPESPHYDVVA